jgi:hypothetical protein
MLTHALIDMALLPLEWTGRHNLEPVTSTGLDRHFALCALGCVTCLAISVVMLSRLRTTRRLSRASEPSDLGWRSGS